MADLDPELVWATQRPQMRYVVTRFLKSLGMAAADWPSVPPVRQLLEMSAIGEFAADLVASMPSLSEKAAYREAARLLGMGDADDDDDDRDSEYNPADRFRHVLNDWKRAARRAETNPLRTPPDRLVSSLHGNEKI